MPGVLRVRAYARHLRQSVAVSVAVLVVAGCGNTSVRSSRTAGTTSSTSSTSAVPAIVTRGEYIKQADAICGPAGANLTALLSPAIHPTPAQVAASMSQVLGIIEKMVQDLKALRGQPVDVAALQTDFIAPMEAIDVAVRVALLQLRRAVGSQAILAALNRIKDAFHDPNQDVHAQALSGFGYNECLATS